MFLSHYVVSALKAGTILPLDSYPQYLSQWLEGKRHLLNAPTPRLKGFFPANPITYIVMIICFIFFTKVIDI